MPELNGDQFSQPRLPGMAMRPGGQQHVGQGNPVTDPARQSNVDDYEKIGGHGAWGPDVDRDTLVENPLKEEGSAYRAADFNSILQKNPGPYERGQQTEYMPTWKAVSEQGFVNPAAVDHMAANANTNDLEQQPDVTSYYDGKAGEEKFLVNDGHHRILGAQKQGRLIIPVSNYGWRAPHEQRDDWVPNR